MIEMTPFLDRNSEKPLYMQLSNYIKQEILSGRIKSNEKLPSKRSLAQYLGISVNTVLAAYDQLSAEGFIVSKPRQGLYAAVIEEELEFDYPYSQPFLIEEEKETNRVLIDFNSGKVDLVHFPYAIWRKLTIQSLYEDQGELFYNGNRQGERVLREQIAKYLFASKGVRCSPDQIIIGAGTQMLIGLLGMIIGKEQIYALEDPGFHRTRMVLQDLGVRTIPIDLDSDGINLSKLKQSNASVVYVTPSHQFPYGMIMPISRRMELLKWAEENDGYIIEDDYDGEYRYKGNPIPSLQGLDGKGKVIYLGTFSKSLIPSLRISYMVLPPILLERYRKHFTIYKQTASRLHQQTLYYFMKDGYWQSHLNKMRTLYRKKHALLMSSVEKYFGKNVNVIGADSGLHIVLEIKKQIGEAPLIESAIASGVKVYPLSTYFHDTQGSPDSKILLGFGGLTEFEIDRGIQLLKAAWGF
ncbi:PLP-dependent aminotransferase family protein [Neobacillus mesonae]|uniref:MocR-like pyridoxine biosynthesis transcription factor PdxR n=1 Tax=Neobacillus mesonae TaxID=1193713 RepID=UPI00203F9A41|nr:PLP-dependent aminotransferase family protein [Neobacillus mesonae]MCM3569947.1 PLP-dependent aminotransferase family protein [Neobacillus mesonae]